MWRSALTRQRVGCPGVPLSQRCINLALTGQQGKVGGKLGDSVGNGKQVDTQGLGRPPRVCTKARARKSRRLESESALVSHLG